MSSTRVIGVGNRFRRDDGLGSAVIQELKKLDLSGVDLMTHSGEGASLMAAMQGYERVIIIDAVAPGNQPGRLHQLNARDTPIPSDFFHYSTHAFSVAEAVEMARVLDELPPVLWIFGLEGADYGSGTGLSEPVQAALPSLVETVLEHLQSV